jgi:hypothetical protein
MLDHEYTLNGCSQASIVSVGASEFSNGGSMESPRKSVIPYLYTDMLERLLELRSVEMCLVRGKHQGEESRRREQGDLTLI